MKMILIVIASGLAFGQTGTQIAGSRTMQPGNTWDVSAAGKTKSFRVASSDQAGACPDNNVFEWVPSTGRLWVCSTGTWLKIADAAGIGGGVTSFNSRTGSITPLLGDYSAFFASLVSGSLKISITKTSAAVMTIGSDCGATTPCPVRTGDSVTQITAGGTLTSVGSACTPRLHRVYATNAGATLTAAPDTTGTCTATGSGITVLVIAAAAYPADSTPLYTINVGAAGYWDDLTGGEDMRAALGREKAYTGGTKISVNATSKAISHDASGISAGTVAYPTSISFDSTGHATAATAGSAPVVNAGDLSRLRKHTNFNEAPAGFGTDSPSPSAVFEGRHHNGDLGEFDQGAATAIAGTTRGINGGGTHTVLFWPAGPKAAALLSMPLFLNGTPKVSLASFEGGKGGIVNGDIYYGYSGSSANMDNFVGIRWNNTAGRWQCGVKNGGSDSGTWATITGETNDSNTHVFTWRTDGTANKVYCSFDGGAEVSPTGSPTFSTFSRILTVLGTPSGITVFRVGQIGIDVAK